MNCPHCIKGALFYDEDGDLRCIVCTRSPAYPSRPPTAEEADPRRVRTPVFMEKQGVLL